MAIAGIQPSFLTSGPEWSVGGVGGLDGVDAGAGSGAAARVGGSASSFGAVLSQQLGALQSSQDAAATASRQLADGTAADPSAAVMAVERARLSMQLASQLRTKGVEAVNEILRTQV